MKNGWGVGTMGEGEQEVEVSNYGMNRDHGDERYSTRNVVDGTVLALCGDS